MLLNCTNHPYGIWSEPMKREAEKLYGEVEELPFPSVDTAWCADDLRREVGAYAARIEAYHADAVLAAGEFTFLFMLVDRLLKDGLHVICSCSERNTVEVKRPDGSNEKKSVFVFSGFRPYARYDEKGSDNG